MKIEQLQRGKEIEDILEKLLKEKKEAELRLSHANKSEACAAQFYIAVQCSTSGINNWSTANNISYISPVVYMESYLVAIKKKVEELEKEFAEL